MTKSIRSPIAADAPPGLGAGVLLGGGPQRKGRVIRIASVAAAAVAVAIGGYFALKAGQAPPAPRYATAAVRRGDLTISVSATGVLEPVNQVDLGSELSGTVDQVLVEENDPVAKGQVLARLDTSRLRDQIANAEAALAVAQAALKQAQATQVETGLKADRLHRLFETTNGEAPARMDIEAADAALGRAEAGAASAKAGIAQAAANLNSARTNLTKAIIRSPIGGVVLSRKVEPGQTVAASLQAPVMFTLAEDLRRMELHVDIDEADVSQVREDQEASFTVDAYSGRSFPARVVRVGLGSQTKEGVVTYTGVLAVDNSDLSLRPGMTASAEIASEQRKDVLTVPIAALQYRPAATGSGPTLASALTPRMPRFGSPQRRRSTNPGAQQIWILRGKSPVAVEVKVGASNGRDVEVAGEGLTAGELVITGAAPTAP